MELTEDNFRLRFNWRTTDPLPVDWMEQLRASLAMPSRMQLRAPMRPPMAPRAPECDLYFYPIGAVGSVPVLRVKIDQKEFAKPEGYLFQGLDANMDIQFETFHVSIADALEQVVRRIRTEHGVARWDVKGL